MSIFATKLLTALLMPLGLGLIILGTAVVLLLLGRRRLGGVLALAGLGWLWVWSLPLTANWVQGSLESHYPPVPVDALPAAEAIVILGGGVGPVKSPRLTPDLRDASDRAWHGARLWHAGKAPLVVVSAGLLPWRSAGGSEAVATLDLLEAFGLPRSAVVLEAASRTTRENAVETAQLLEPMNIRRVLLVTSAAHMRRAEASFRRVGFEVIAAATDYESVGGGPLTLLELLPSAGALDRSSAGFKEHLGLLAYRMRGWTG